MGTRQRAQKRGKAPKGSQKGTPTSQRKLNSSMHVPDLSTSTRSNALLGWQDDSPSSSPLNRRGFTMGDAARNTERHPAWGQSKLRDQGISFISAGTLHQDPEHVRAQDDEQAEEDTESADANANGQEESEVELQEEIREQSMEDVHTTTLPIRNGRADNTIPKPDVVAPKRKSVSPAPSSSSETEQIVFTGRSKVPIPNSTSQGASKKTSRVHSPVKSIPAKEQTITSTALPPASTSKSIPIIKKVVETSEIEASSSDRRVTNARLQRRGRKNRRQSDLDEQEAIMRDYIANMAMDDTEDEEEAQPLPLASQSLPFRTKARKNETYRFYDGAGMENEKVQLQSKGPKPVPRDRDIDQAMDWNSDDLQDFDDISTTDDDEIVEIEQVLRQRERHSGIQYLVVPLGMGASDAKWLLDEVLVSESARKEIAIYEEILAMEFDEESLDEDDDEDDEDTTDDEVAEALNDLIDHIESEDDENARIIKHTARMTDEQIARALAKQEELGMGGDELMLFSGDVDEDDDVDVDMDDAFGRNDDFVSFSLQRHTSNRTRSKRNKKGRDSFPSAAAFADALDEDPYGAFDVMDFDRPSLRPKKKGRKSDFPYDLELEDEDLREQLVSTWTKDRDKKVQRKVEKEEARQATLLAYADRSEPSAIKAEIRRFLVTEIETLRLSPMESSTRASVHRLAKALKLNSHSEGKEGTTKGRYPVLTKTIRTPSYTIDTVWEVDALLNTRKFFPKNAGSYKKEKLPRGTARGMRMRQSGGVSGASYMNGEVVGASAPEIGIENKGRAMLEKMGWTSGMGIGAEGNKGSLEAVKHVFKVSRAGLG